MHIVLTNDDGIQASGLRALYHGLRNAGHKVTVIAPVTEQSAVGHAITFALPLRVKEFNEQSFQGLGVYGTPVDCMKLGLTSLVVNDKPDLILSGINAGANIGPDILYSGTVAAATEAAHMGYHSMALSFDSFQPDDLSEQAAFTAKLIERLPWDTLPPRCVLNLNFPNLPMACAKELKVCEQTDVVWRDWYEKAKDPRGNTYWWINGEIPESAVVQNSDYALLNAGHITLTPLRFEFTDHTTMQALRGFGG
jgi:5'-nucleotidase